jgi:hypothetical protein
MISEHIKRNTFYTLIFNLSDSESVYAAIKHLRIDPRCAKLLGSLPPGYCIVLQTQGSWSSAFLCKIDFVEPDRNSRVIQYDNHPFVPAITDEQMGKIIGQLHKLFNGHKETGNAKDKQSDLETIALKLIQFWAEKPYTPVVRLFENLGDIHYTVQIEIRNFIEDKEWAKFVDTRIGRAPALLMELTEEGYKALQMPMPEGNHGRGGIEHRTYSHIILSYWTNRGCKAYLEGITENSKHPIDVLVEHKDHLEAYEVCVSATENLTTHANIFEKNENIKTLTVVTATKAEHSKIKKLIRNNLLLARFKDRIKLDVIENYMERNKK